MCVLDIKSSMACHELYSYVGVWYQLFMCTFVICSFFIMFLASFIITGLTIWKVCAGLELALVVSQSKLTGEVVCFECLVSKVSLSLIDVCRMKSEKSRMYSLSFALK